MHLKLCVKWETKIVSCENFSLSLINGSSNYCLSNVGSHFKSMMHLTAIEKEKRNKKKSLGAITNGKQNTVPSNALIKSIKIMSSVGDEQDMLKRLIEVSQYTAVNGCPYTDFHGLIELEKMHRVKFLKGKS